MNIHDPKAHTGMIGVLALVLTGMGADISVTFHNLPKPEGYTASQVSLNALPFGKHDWTVFASPGSGAFPEAIAAAIRGEGDKAAVEGDLLPHEGIWLSPDNDETRALASKIGTLIGEPVKVGNAAQPGFQIGIGRPSK